MATKNDERIVTPRVQKHSPVHKHSLPTGNPACSCSLHPLCTKYYVFNTYCTPCLHKQSPCTQRLPSFANVLITPHVHKHPWLSWPSFGHTKLPTRAHHEPPPPSTPLAQWSLNITSVDINTSPCQGSHFSGLTKFPDFSLTFPVFFPFFQYFV